MYKGRPPNSDFSVTHKQYVDTAYATAKVDLAYINQAVAHEALNLVTTIYVDQQDGFLAQKTTADVADTNYLSVSELGQPNGLARLGLDTYVPTAQLPALQTERRVTFKNADSLFLTSTRELSVVNPRDYEVGRLTIADPGYPYVPLLFAMVTGGSVNGTAATGALGTGNFAQLSVMRDTIRYSYLLTSSQKTYETFTVLPTADPANSGAPLSGDNTFSLWAGLDRGTTYTLNAVGLAFFAMVFPGL